MPTPSTHCSNLCRTISVVCAVLAMVACGEAHLQAQQAMPQGSGFFYPPQSGVLPGDTRGSSSEEARSMSPPHWGAEPQFWTPPPNSTEVPLPGGEGQPAVLPHDNPENRNTTSASATLPRNSAYRSVLDPGVFEPAIEPTQDPMLGYGEKRQPTMGSSTTFFEPQSPYERGFRSDFPLSRGTAYDNGDKFEYETKKKQYPPMKEIIATGRFFGMGEAWLMRPYFNNNTAGRIQGPNFGESFQADHAFETAPRIRLGFESKYGPGAELQLFQFDHNSNPIFMTSDGINQAIASVDAAGFGSPITLATSNAGEQMEISQALEVNSFLFAVFKEAKLPISRINGMMGMRYASIAQEYHARLLDGASNQLATLDNVTDFRGYGPYFGIEYYRPVGHTKLELLASAAGSLLLGNRDQSVNQNGSFVSRRTGIDEVVTTFDVLTGIQYAYHYAENRSYYARLAYQSQVWLNGGAPSSPSDDFGFRGVAFAVGFNR
ncbi:MAG: Lpg1974 family pore-forming outer membrane protein [Pirellulaceae bacterium]